MEIFKELEKNVLKFGKVNIPVIFDRNDEAWFAAKSVAKALGYSDTRQALQTHVDESEINQIRNLNAEYDSSLIHPQTLFMNEYGLYSLVMGSTKPKAKEFTRWIRYEVLPSIRKYGSYRLKKEYDMERSQLLKDITYLERQNNKLKGDLRKEEYPDGGMIYAVDFSDDHDGEEVYRIGMTANMKQRERLYKTHMLHKRKVIILKEIDDPHRFELCLKSMLFDKRYQYNRDFYVCSRAYLKRAVNECTKNFKGIDKTGQKGGGFDFIDNRVSMLKRRIGVLEKGIIKCDLKLAE